MSRSRDICDEKGLFLLTRGEAFLRNRLRRLALRSDFGPCSLSRAFHWWFQQSRSTKPRPKRTWLCRNIHWSRGRACCTEQVATFGIGFLVSCCGSISARVIFQGYLRCPKFPTHHSVPENREALSRYPLMMGSRLLHRAGCLHSESASQYGAADRFWPLPCLKGISAVPTHESQKKSSSFVEISANHWGRACCTGQKAHIRNRLLRLARRIDFGSGHHSRASAPEKTVALSRYSRIKVSLPLTWAGSSNTKSALQTGAAQQFAFGPRRLSRTSRWSQYTIPRQKRMWLCQDIRKSRGRACWAAELSRMLISRCRHDSMLSGFPKLSLLNWWPLDDVDIDFVQIFRQIALPVFWCSGMDWSAWNRKILRSGGRGFQKWSDVITMIFKRHPGCNLVFEVVLISNAAAFFFPCLVMKQTHGWWIRTLMVAQSIPQWG